MSDSTLISMDDLLVDSPEIYIPIPGTLVDGTVITVQGNQVLVNINDVSTGVISGKEAVDSSDTVKNLEEGDLVSAFVLEPENDEGLVVLSLRKASQQKTWTKFTNYFEDKSTIQVRISEANKGGLLVEVDGIKGFVPVSQLAPMHYPRVNGADSAKILSRLQKLIGEEINVRIINIDHDTRKLILSEKAAQNDERKKALTNVKIGDVLDGTISGVVNFGIFVTFSGLEGLVHISEIAWGHVNDPSAFGKLGGPVKIKVIGIEGEKISLSMKRLTPNPWEDITKNFEIGQVVKGKVNRVTDYGAFVTLGDDINGLIHVSELSEGEDDIINVSEKFTVGDAIDAVIINIDIDNHRIGLGLPGGKSDRRLKAAKEAPAADEETKKTEVKLEKEAETKKVVDSNSIDSLELSPKLTKALTDAGFNTLDDLKGKTEADLTALDGVGPATAKKIIESVS